MGAIHSLWLATRELRGLRCRRLKATLSATLIACGLVGCGGCSKQSPYAVQVPNFDPEAASASAIGALDANGDGSLDSDELKSCPPLSQSAKSIDTNGDGRLSQEEIAARLRVYGSANTGMQSLNCKVIANGRPLAGATVRFVPVEFLEGEIPPAMATTRANGTGPAIIEGTRLPGLSPGLYRVEVSLTSGDDERIAAEYNSQSQLGFELLPDETPKPAEFRVTFR